MEYTSRQRRVTESTNGSGYCGKLRMCWLPAVRQLNKVVVHQTRRNVVGSLLYATKADNLNFREQVEQSKLYSNPELYEAVFSFRDFKDESTFICELSEKHGSPLSSECRLLDLGCGTGRHCMELVSKGYSVTGVDSSKPMLEYAQRIASEKGVSYDLVEGDMTNFSIPKKFSLVTMMLGTLSHLHTNEEVLQCFANVHEHLNNQGLFVIELAHPSQLFNIYNELGAEAWDVKMNGQDIVVQYGLEDDIFDANRQILSRSLHLNFKDKNGKIRETFEDHVSQRYFTVQEIRLLAKLSGFDVAEIYGDTNLGEILGTEADQEFRMIVCLKKQERST